MEGELRSIHTTLGYMRGENADIIGILLFALLFAFLQLVVLIYIAWQVT
jgi:hypothetical protein